MSKDPRRFDNKVAVVTGGTQGVGENVALQLAERGASGVLITGRNEERGEEVSGALRELGTKPLFVAADLADVGAPLKIIGAADEVFGRVDVLANCAANPERDTIWDSAPEFFDRGGRIYRGPSSTLSVSQAMVDNHTYPPTAPPRAPWRL
jgi:NAD(P)-dependent dehydrogenase (short-subunit alcohol dehydrogenase family)